MKDRNFLALTSVMLLLAVSASVTTIQAASARAQQGSACAGPSNGRVSCWKAENNADDSVDGNHGTLQGGLGFASGKSGQAFNLDGINDYVSIAHTNALNPSGPFSVDLWIKANPQQTSNQSLIIDKSHGFIDSTGWGIQTNTDGTGCFFYGTGGGGSLDFHGPCTRASILDNQWHHLAGVWTGSEIRIYKDAELQNTLAFSTTPVTNTRDVHIGMAWGGGTPTRFFHGLIDEVEYYNRALTVTEITAIYSAGACAGPANGRVSCWKAEDNATDSWGGNDGVLQGGATFAPGKVGQAFSFNGSTSTVIAADASSLDLTTQFTFDAWINPASLHTAPPFPGKGGVISKVGGPNGNNGYQFGIAANNTQVFCQFNAQGESWPANQLLANIPVGIPINAWTHLACTYDNANLAVYVNGRFVGSKFIGAKNLVNSASNLRISSDDNGNVFFDGLIDEVKIYNRALSQEEIAAICGCWYNFLPIIVR